MIPDRELLERYAQLRDEDAFTALVDRHLPLVYSVALRQVQDSEAARDLAQQVFFDLARKASKLKEVQVLGGWLYQHTVFISSTARRSERRRKARDTIMNDAVERQEPGNALNEAVFAAMQVLNPADRDALILRFLEGRSIKEVGHALECTEEAARKRIDRAAERLREALRSKGIASSSGLIGSALMASVMAVPQGLVSTIAASVVGASPITSAVTLTLFEFMNTKVKTALVAGLLTIGVSTPVLMQRKINRLETKVTQLQSRNNEVPQVVDASEESSAGNVTDESQVEWDELTFRGRLKAYRAKGLPEATIEAILRAEVDALFRAKLTNTPVFQTVPSFATVGREGLRNLAYKRMEELHREADQERKQALSRLLGRDVPIEPTPLKVLRADLDAALMEDILPPDKLAALKEYRLEVDQKFVSEIAPTIKHPNDREEYLAHKAEVEAWVSQVLSPEEKEIYDLRTSMFAETLRGDLTGLSLSEEQFKAIYAGAKRYEFFYDAWIRVNQEDAFRARLAVATRSVHDVVRDVVGEQEFLRWVTSDFALKHFHGL